MDLSRISAFKGSRWYKRLVWALVAFVLYVLLGFFALPPIIKWQLLKHLPVTTKRHAAIEQVKFNPLVLSLTIRGLTLTEPDGRTFASWEELYINFQTSSLFRWAWTFKEIRLVKPYGEIIVLPDGRLNFANIFDSPPKDTSAARQKETSVPRINIFELLVTNGFVALQDQTRHPAFHTEYRPINWVLNNFSTRPGVDTPYSFRAASDAGRSIIWEGDLSVQPLRSNGHLELNGIRLPRWQPYYEDYTHAQVTNGTADIVIDYQFATGTNGTDLIVKDGTVRVAKVQVLDPENAEQVAGLENIDIRRLQLNLRERTAGVGSIKVSEASALVRRKQNGHLNLLDLIVARAPATNSPSPPAAAAPVAPAPPWTANVGELTIEKTSVNLEDLALHTPVKTRLDPIEFTLKDFTTGTNSKARYSIHIVTESSETSDGSGTFSINPLSSAGEAKWSSIDLKKYLPYAESFFRGKLTAGKLAVQVPYNFSIKTNGFDAGVSNVSVTITGLELKGPDSDENIVSIPRFALEGVEAYLGERSARVASIKTEQGSVLCRRQRDGSINLLQLLVPASTNQPPAEVSAHPAKDSASSNAAGATNETAGWIARIDDISVNDYTIKLEDQQPPKPATFLLDRLALNVKDASTLSNTPISARLDLRFNESGAVAMQAKATLEPRVADVQLGLTNIDLRAVQPYLEDYVRLDIVSGAMGGDFAAHYQTANTGAAQVKVTGQVNIANFACADQVASKELLRWDDLAVSGIDAELEPTRLKVAEIKWVAPKTSVVIGPDHRPNVASIMKKGGADSTNAAPQVAQTVPAQTESITRTNPAIPIQVDAILLEKAALSVTDESIEPHPKIAIEELSGSIKGLSSTSNSPANVDFAGKIDEHSPIAIKGHVNPLSSDLFADLVISTTNTLLTPFSPYTSKYAGHPLNRGRLSTDLHYQIEGKALKAENKIYVDQLMLGPRNNSPDATTLPVKLGIALLKDSQGRITLDVPVDGRLDDPQFRIAPIVLKVIVNMITKAAASPFKLLGAVVGGGEEMSYVKFYPGSTNVVEGELDKLGKLSKALAQRPALSLEIDGAIDPIADRQALAAQKLRDQLKAKELQQLDTKGNAAQAVESFQISDEDYHQLLRAAFAEKFGTNIAAILQTNQMALAVTNKPTGRTGADSSRHPKKSLSKRFLSWIGLGGHSHQSKAEKNLSKADRLALRQLPPEQMETMLADGIKVTDDDYRELMNARAHLVQTWLVEQAQVSNERLLLGDPKPVSADYQGESEVQLSLQ